MAVGAKVWVIQHHGPHGVRLGQAWWREGRVYNDALSDFERYPTMSLIRGEYLEKER